MNLFFLLLPVVGALIGFFMNWMTISFFFYRYLPKKQPAIAHKIGKLAADNLSISDLAKKLGGEESMQKILPVMEGHIDDFLRNRLGKAMPIISMFIGDKTINQLKAVFMKELETIVPATINSFMQNMKKDIDIEKTVSEKITAIPSIDFSQRIKEAFSDPIKKVKLLGALTGLIIGVVQMLIVLLVSKP